MEKEQFGPVQDVFLVKGDQFLLNQFITDGTIINRLEVAEYDHVFYQFPALIIWKFYLEMASDDETKAFAVSQSISRTLQKERTKDKKKIYTLATNNPSDLLKYFRFIISAYVFSFNALEAYLNLRIDSFSPDLDDYVKLKELTKNFKTSVLLHKKEDLIKECSIEDKLIVILPYILRKKSINYKVSSLHKTSFKRILFVRNELNHYKRLKQRSSAQNGTFKTSRLWNQLIPAFKDNKINLNFHPATFVVELIKTIEDRFSRIN
ncbi:hypothetical protein [Legionella sp. PC997]|uniref:hypothetical protein n=1 Tax=Legionella sp. PC997 TaxID=2755562 RepID=UPI0015FE502B|nr:hypothetical protein [Legionella sp. PC997]QMT62077.1 hypothetical protein HBNCFIEN_03485 [Legionella sp. PC997]